MSTGRIAFLDVDGTILDHGRTVAASTVDAVRAARAAGHLVYLCTGRSAGDIHPDVAAIGFDGAITNGGSYATSGDDVVVARPMPRDAVDRLQTWFTEAGVPYFLQTNDGVYASARVREMIAAFVSRWQSAHSGDEPQTSPQRPPRFGDLAEVDLGTIAKAVFVSDDPDTVEVLIGQMVNLVRDGQPVRMSKRAGTVITLDDLVEAIGVDAARYALIRSSVDTPIDIDLELWSSASNENPVYYVQYAHARLSALARNAADLGVAPDTAHLDLLTHDKEGTLIRNLGEFSRVLETAAGLREPHRVSRYLEDLAGDYHRFYDSCRVLPQGDEEPGELHSARLALCQATRQVIANGLAILGVSAPERM